MRKSHDGVTSMLCWRCDWFEQFGDSGGVWKAKRSVALKKAGIGSGNCKEHYWRFMEVFGKSA